MAVTLTCLVAAPLSLAQQALAGQTVENFNNADDNYYDSGAASSFSLDGITYTIAKTGWLADSEVTQDINLQGLPDEDGSDEALLFDEYGTGGISAVTITMTDGRPFDIASLDIDTVADANISFLANGNPTSVSVSSDEEWATDTVELALANPVFADVSSLTIEGANLFEPNLGHIVYTELSPPVLTTAGASTSFTAGDNTASAPVAVDTAISVADPESSTLATATVSITGDFHSGQDVLAFTNTSATTFGNISGSFNAATGVLNLTSSGATAALAQWRAALEAVTYTDTAITPDTDTRTVSFQVNDGTVSSNTATKTVTVTDVDQTPVVTTGGNTTDYPAGSTAMVIDAAVTVTDGDNTTQASGTAAITAGFHSGDTLGFANTSATLFGNISASYNSTTGVLSLTSPGASATDAQWSEALGAVTFSTWPSPSTGYRTVAFATNDGTDPSEAATDVVEVTSGSPVLSTAGASTSFSAGDNTASTPVAVDSAISVVDPESSTLATATVSMTGNFHSGQDVLSFTNTSATTFGNISGSFDAGTGVLSLTSSGAAAVLAQWQAALQAVTYNDTAITPSTATRTVSFEINDGTAISNTATKTVTVTDVDQTPVVTTSAGEADFVAPYGEIGPAVEVDPSIKVGDLDNSTLGSGTESITGNFNPSEDVLAFANTSATTFGNISASYNSTTGVLSLTSPGASATDAQWQAALRAVTYTDTSASPNTTTRTVSFVVNDGAEGSAPVTRAVTVSQSAAPSPSSGPPSAGTPTVSTLGSSSNPASVGHQVTLWVTVSPVPDGGTVTFTQGSAIVAGCSALTVNAMTGVAECSYLPSAVGAELIQASYSGDPAFGSSTGSLTQVVKGVPGKTTPPRLVSSPCRGESGDSAFVCRVYADLFGRAPDAVGSAHWLAMLNDGAGRTAVAGKILASTEYQRQMVRTYYETLLGRPAVPATVESWVEHLAHGTTDDSVIAGLLGTAQYYAKSGGTGPAFVSALYEDLLGRAPEAAGLALWEGQLSAGSSRSAVVLEILSGPEYRLDFVEAQYERFLGHRATQDELSSGLAGVAQGGSDDSVIAGIVGSAEFFADSGSNLAGGH